MCPFIFMKISQKEFATIYIECHQSFYLKGNVDKTLKEDKTWSSQPVFNSEVGYARARC